MAGENRKETEQLDGVIQSEGKGTGRKKNRTPGTESTGTGTGTGTGTATGTATEKERVPELAVLEPKKEPPAPQEPKKAKKKRTNPNKQKNNPTFNAEQITALLMSMSAICSQSEAGKFFVLSEAEANQIAVPLANIISKNDAFAGLGEHSDSIALGTACFMIFLPRVLGWLGYRKTKNAMKKNNVMILKGETTNGQKRENSRSSGQAEGTVTPGNEMSGNGLLSQFPSLA